MSKELEELRVITRNKIEYIKKQPKIDGFYLKYYEGVLNSIDKQEKEIAKYKRILNIIKEKNVDYYLLDKCNTVGTYNTAIKLVWCRLDDKEISDEEFDLLKEDKSE